MNRLFASVPSALSSPSRCCASPPPWDWPYGYYMDAPWTLGRARAGGRRLRRPGRVRSRHRCAGRGQSRLSGAATCSSASIPNASESRPAAGGGHRRRQLQAAQQQAAADYQRYSKLSDAAVTQQKLELARATALEAKAAYEQAMADRDLAKLNLARSEVRASVNGRITNMDLRPGAYVSVGKGVMALIDSATLRVEGYFEETKLPRIHVGDPATIRLMGETTGALPGDVGQASQAASPTGKGALGFGRSPRQRQPDLHLGPPRATRPRSHRPGSCSRRREARRRPNGDSVDQPAGRPAAFSIEAVANNSKLCLGHEGLLKIGSVGRWTQRYAPVIRSISGRGPIFR